MKRALSLMFVGAAVVGLFLAALAGSAWADLTLSPINSDAQTYVVSGTQANSNSGGTPYDDTNFSTKGGAMISADVADPGAGKTARAMDGLFSFNTSSALSSLSGLTITSVTIQFYSNYYLQGQQPNNADFNTIASGNFNLGVLSANPSISTVTWNTLQTFLASNTDSNVGTCTWTSAPAGTNVSEWATAYSLNVTSDLVNDILSGEIYFLGTAADSNVGFLFNTNTKGYPPQLVITAEAAPVPVPPAFLLFGSGIGALGFLRRRVFKR